MKCPRCWADKAYLHVSRGWWETVLGWLAFRPMKCTHCYHRFMVHWIFTIGKRVVPPVLRVTPRESREGRHGAVRRGRSGPRRKNAA